MALSEYDPRTVKVAIREWELGDYLEAADYINKEGFGLVLLQYEFGIWPVAHVLCFARAVKTRLITTIHTVARTYASEEYHAYVLQLATISHKLTVMTERMRHELDAFHAVPPRRVAVIPHGAPSRPLRRVQGTPRQSYFPGRKLIMSNGLMHGYKGIEYMLEAMPAVLAKHPDALYLVDGKPHPGGWGVQGYYAGLKRRASELGLLGTSVVFHNAFAPYDELLAKLEAAWVYVNPYTDASQSVSGTVAMALAAGAAVVSTPYPYATETLAGGVGVFVPFRDSAALTVAISDLLDSPLRVARLNLAAHAYAQNMTWEKVARAHLDLARSLGDD
jgi:glycosyltransferase involved in cell wall biosynthesis